MSIEFAGRAVTVGTIRRSRHPFTLAVLSVLLLSIAGCSTARTSAPNRTATEQLLISTAADDAIEQLDLGLPPGTDAYIDGAFLEAFDKAYVIGAIRDKLLRSGLNLVAERDRAEVVIEPRSGALSIDEDEFLIGVPSWDVPVPFATAPLVTPELAVYKRHRREGIAKLALTAYAVQGGGLAGSSGPVIGQAHRTRRVLLFVGWTEQDIPPERRAMLR